MSFGNRSSGRDTFSQVLSRGTNLPLIIAAGAAGLVICIGVAVANFNSDSHVTRFAESAAKLGVTEEVRQELREQFQKELQKMDGDLCEETYRVRAGKAAVKYYETLLEKPVLAGGLEFTYDNRCQHRTGFQVHPLERMLSVKGLGGNLTLPWDCMPSSWRTPTDRALQAKLEKMLSVGYLTTDTLSGTLAVIARSPKLSPIASICRRPAESSRGYRRASDLPLISTPTDDWDRGSRRRRY